jgi:DNA modification methylase
MENESVNKKTVNWLTKTVDVSDLKPFEKNPRKINPEEFDALKRSIAEDGYHQRIICTPDMRVIGGHQRIKALKELGFKTIDVLVANRSLPDDQFKRILVRDNLAYGAWDFEALGDLMSVGELEELGMSDDVTRKIKDGTEGLTDPDEAPEVPAEPFTAYGDVWRLGEHTVMCGDSTKQDDVARLMAGKKADMVFTDPPYGIKRDKGFGGSVGFGGEGKKIKRREYADDWDSERPDAACFQMISSLAKSVIIWGGNFFADFLPVGNHWIVWDKLNTMPTFGDCELAWTNIKRNSVKKCTIQYNGLIGKEKERVHPTQKPVALAEWCFENYGETGDKVLDLFLGSGSTLIACEKTVRICYGMELSEAYCDVIVKRWQAFTGKEATHAQTGERFNSRIPLSETRQPDAARMAAGQ